MPALMERFIPVDVDELMDDLVAVAGNDKLFHRTGEIFIALYHAQFHRQIRDLRNCYSPFNPDRDTVSRHFPDATEQKALQEQLLQHVTISLERANFVALPQSDINAALAKTSPHGVEVSVDFDDFEEISLYYRGTTTRLEYKREWRSAFLKKIPVEVALYRRLFLLLKAKPLSVRVEEVARVRNISTRKAAKQVQRSRALLAEQKDSPHIHIKLFKDIPQSDLEMLFPNTQVRMRVFDKVKLAITGGGGTIGGIMATLTKISAAANPITAITAIGGLAGIIWRQITKVFAQRTKYMATLAKHLYFYNLDNNAGALAHLVELAEAEECKEALLAYFFLHFEDKQRHTEESLDKRIETYLQESYETAMDFEIQDGLRKLRDTGLLVEDDTRLRVLAPADAIAKLDSTWDALFTPD